MNQILTQTDEILKNKRGKFDSGLIRDLKDNKQDKKWMKIVKEVLDVVCDDSKDPKPKLSPNPEHNLVEKPQTPKISKQTRTPNGHLKKLQSQQLSE